MTSRRLVDIAAVSDRHVGQLTAVAPKYFCCRSLHLAVVHKLRLIPLYPHFGISAEYQSQAYVVCLVVIRHRRKLDDHSISSRPHHFAWVYLFLPRIVILILHGVYAEIFILAGVKHRYVLHTAVGFHLYLVVAILSKV